MSIASFIQALSANADHKPYQPLWSSSEAEVILKEMIANRWQRLLPHEEDPLDILYHESFEQWTLGWDHQGMILYLLVWDVEDWNKSSTWKLYANGVLKYQYAQHRKSKDPVLPLLKELFEGSQLETISLKQLLAPLTSYQIPREHREYRVEVIADTVKAHPALLGTFKTTLLELLREELGINEWPMLDLMKIHRLDQKTILLQLLKRWVEEGKLEFPERQHLHASITLLFQDYQRLSPYLAAYVRPEFDRAYRSLQQLTSQGLWWIRLQQHMAFAHESIA